MTMYNYLDYKSNNRNQVDDKILPWVILPEDD
jgi:hypothetical protein